MTAVHVQSVTKRFGETTVLHGIDAEIPQGAFAVLVGPSGCGKSTLLRLIAGLEQVTAGRILFGERDVTSLPPRDRDIAMVFQSYALYPHMTVRDNMAFGLQLRKTDPATIEARVSEVARTLDIEHLLGRYPRQLSGGQRQRVAMGRAIVRRPALFMFDEPLSNLDPALRTQVRVDIRRLHDAHDATSVYVTHDQVEAMTLADILFVLEGGHVQQSGPPLEVYERPINRFVAGFLGSPAMNMVPATIQGRSLQFNDGGSSLALEGVTGFEGLSEGRAVDVGIRAQDVERCSDAEADLHATVRFVETLGSHVHVHGSMGEASFIASFEGSRGPDAGDVLPLRVARFHLFDAESGKSLRTS
ncbi:MAG: sn-glycerol-3-phosphate ABC transporter ATP-binding protein UgpC [Nannocystaceae bacterium]|nr:sn-glycerol-3-phosphate ABC transporter ATP-binding protein UgpC [Nannocystaceae bacterium]